MPGRCTARRWSVWWRATTPSRVMRACAWPSGPRTCSARVTAARTAGLDVTGLDGVIVVDPGGSTADVRGMCTYEHLVDGDPPARPDAARRPPAEDHHPGRRRDRPRHRVDLVPQRPAPRVGRSRWTSSPGRARWSRPSPTARTPTSSAASPTPTAPSATPPGCGSSSSRWAASSTLRHVRFHDLEALVECLERDRPRQVPSTGSRSTTSTAWCSPPPSPTSSLGRQQRRARPDERLHRACRSTTGPSSTTAHAPTRDRLTTYDYLWRWDTDWFWCSRAFGAQDPRVRRLWPRRWRRSSVYWKLIALDRRFVGRRPARGPQGPAAARAGGPGRRDPAGRDAPSSCAGSCARCPSSRSGCARLRSGVAAAGPAVAALPAARRRDLRQRRLLVVACRRTPATRARPRTAASSSEVTALGGHKSLYSESFYDERRVRPALRRRRLRRAQGRAGTPTAGSRPLRQGGAAEADRTHQHGPGTTAETTRRAVASPRSSSPSPRGRCRCGSPPTTAAPPARPTHPAACTCDTPRARPTSPPPRATSGGPRLRLRRPRLVGACTPATPTTGSSQPWATCASGVPPPRPRARGRPHARASEPAHARRPRRPRRPCPGGGGWPRGCGTRRPATPRRSATTTTCPTAFYEHGPRPLDDLHLRLLPRRGARPSRRPRRTSTAWSSTSCGLTAGRPAARHRLRLGRHGPVRRAARRAGASASRCRASRPRGPGGHRATRASADLAEVRFSDYRDVPETGFDAVSSIGLTEHIGVRNYPAYFRLHPGQAAPGRAAAQPLHHPARQPHPLDRAPSSTATSSPTASSPARARIITAAQDVGPRGAPRGEPARALRADPGAAGAATSRSTGTPAWPRWARATAQVWGLYMAGSRFGFERNEIQLHQVLAVKPDPHGHAALPLRPWWSA